MPTAKTSPATATTFHYPSFDPGAAQQNKHDIRQIDDDDDRGHDKKFRRVLSSSKSKSKFIFARCGFPANVDGTHIFAVQIDKSKVSEDTYFGFASGPRDPLLKHDDLYSYAPASVGTLLCPYNGLRTITPYWRRMTDTEMNDSCLEVETDETYEKTPSYTEEYFEIEKDYEEYGSDWKKRRRYIHYYCERVSFLICILTISDGGKTIQVQWVQDGKEGPIVDCTEDFDEDDDDDEKEPAADRPPKMIFPVIAFPEYEGYGATFVTPDKLCQSRRWLRLVFSGVKDEREKLMKKVKKLKKKLKKLKKKKSGKRRQRDEEEESDEEEEEEEEEEENENKRELDRIIEKIDSEIAQEAAPQNREKQTEKEEEENDEAEEDEEEERVEESVESFDREEDLRIGRIEQQIHNAGLHEIFREGEYANFSDGDEYDGSSNGSSDY